MKLFGDKKAKKNVLLIIVSGILLVSFSIALLGEFVPNDVLAQILPGAIVEAFTPIKSVDKDRKPGVTVTLIAGMQKAGDLTDVLILVICNEETDQISMLSIPRDSMIKTDRNNKKINNAHARGGEEELLKEVKSITGITPDRVVYVNLKGVAAIIDAVDGVTYDVPMDMKYTDPTQDLYINLKKGPQKLNGDQSLQLLRFRSGYAQADIGRINTQQGFLKEALKQIVQLKNIGKVGTIADLISKSVKTDYTISEMIYYGKWMAGVNKDDDDFMYSDHLPGAHYKPGSIAYWRLDPEKLIEVLNHERINPYTYEIKLSDLDINKG